MSLSFAPLIPWVPLAALALLALLVWGLAVLRRARGAWLRLVPLAVLLLTLANPRLVSEDRQPLNDVAVVLVDESASQDMGDRRAQTAQALAQVRERLARLPNLDVRVESVRGAQDGTRMFAALDRVLADLPRRRLAGVVVITDGRIHDVPADHAKELGAPLHALVTGRPDERDRRIHLVNTPGFALVGRIAPVVVRVDDPGAQGIASVELRVDGQPYISAPVPLNRDVTVDIPIRHAGPNVVELVAESAPGELSQGNNRAAFGISGVRDRLKVLLISGEPHAGERTWRNLLKSDPGVDLVHFTILRPPEKDDRTPIRELALITFPVRELFEEKLAEFDLVVFDRYRSRGVLSGRYYQRIAEYVRNGGALLASVGPEFAEPFGLADSPLATLLPALPSGGRILDEGFKPTITEIGRRHPVSAALPGGETDPPRWGSWMRQAPVDLRRGDAVLAGAEGRPLVVLDKVGEGRVAQVLSDTIWLWARGYEGGGPHAELMRRLAHWLMKEPELEEEQLTAEVRNGVLTAARRSLAPPPATVMVTRPDGTRLDLALADRGDGSAAGTLDVDQPGLWRVDDGTRTAIAAMGTLAPIEMDELIATISVLAPVAEATGGSVRFLAEGGVPDFRRVAPERLASGRGWAGLTARGGHVVTGVREIPLIPAILLLFLGLGGLLAAWKREGR